jgi:acyl-CoA thioesterase
MSFDQALVLRSDNDASIGAITPEWAQGRAAFGGLLVGLALRAIAPRMAPDRRLRSVLVDFVSPAEVGPIRVETRVLRNGRALTHVEARLVQGGDVRVVVLAAYGASRATAVHWEAPPAPSAAPPDSLPAFPYIEGVTPRFTQQFHYRWTSSALPFTGSDDPTIGGWVRLAAPVPVDEAVVAALLDAWPAPVLPLMKGPAPASTATWMIDLVAPIDAPPDAWWRFEGTTSSAGEGHASVDGRLWGPDGRLIALSRQLVVEFSSP